MNKVNKFALVCVLFFVLVNCSHGKKQIKSEIEAMQSTPVNLCLDKMDCRHSPLPKMDRAYKMVVYVDSSECSSCALSHLRFWNPLIDEARKKKIDIDYLFIVAPKPQGMDDLNMELEISDLSGSIYVDTAYVFKKANPMIPEDKKYHSFLLDKNNEVIMVGSPVDNKSIKKVYDSRLH